MLKPAITIAMPVYNAGSDLKVAVQSIINQTFVDWVLIIIDDGSTDGAINSIKDIKDDRVKIICDSENKGIAHRLNQAISMANTEFFARMDADDISLPERLEAQYNLINSDPTIDVVACRSSTMDGTNIIGELPFRLTHKEIIGRPWFGFYFAHPTWLGRLSWFEKYKYSLSAYYCEDQELLLRTYTESKFETVNKILFRYRLASKVVIWKRLKTHFAFFLICTSYFAKKRNFVFIFFAFVVLILRSINTMYLMFREKAKLK